MLRLLAVSILALSAGLAPAAARAERVLVLELDGDSDARLRGQIEVAVRKKGKVQLATWSDYQSAAQRRGVSIEGAQRLTALPELATSLGVSAVLTGSIVGSLEVRILDASGQQVWTKQLPLRDGLLSADHARRLASALAAAARAPHPPGQLQKAPEPAPATVAASEPVPPSPAPISEPPRLPPPPPSPEPVRPVAPPARVAVVAPAPSQPAPVIGAPPPPVAVAAGPTEPPPEEVIPPPPPYAPTRPSSMRAPGELDYAAFEGGGRPPPSARDGLRPRGGRRGKSGPPGSRRIAPRYAPKIFRLELGALGVLRSYCARPGVNACEAYDNAIPGTQPFGPTADFHAKDVYPGGVASLELFPLAGMEQPFLRGLGVIGGYHRGFSSARAPGLTAGGTPTQVPVRSIDESYWVMAAARYYFGWDDWEAVSGYIGLRLGFVARGFTPDLPADVFLPATRRKMGVIGIDVLLPVKSGFKIELGAVYYFAAGVAADDAVQLGTQTDSLGFAAHGGVQGDFANGPLGYFARAQWARFDDTFGAGGSAWGAGGFARETYVTISGGLTLSF